MATGINHGLMVATACIGGIGSCYAVSATSLITGLCKLTGKRSPPNVYVQSPSSFSVRSMNQMHTTITTAESR